MALKVGELFATFGIDSSTLDDSLADIEKKCNDVASSMAAAGAGMSAGLTAPIVAFGKSALNTGKEFEAQMSRVGAIAEATGTELQDLTQNAIDLGASTSFSSTEVAEGMENLASAGFGAADIMKAMPGMLDLAASSGEDLATSAEIAATTLRGFGLEADNMNHVADVLAKNAARTNAGVADTGEAMKYVAPLAKTMGLSLEEVTAAIGIMSNNGIKGSQAGTTLRGALSRLAKPTETMQNVMKQLNLDFYDSNGQMKSLTSIVSMLQTNMSGLTQEQQQNALVTLFGQNALSGMMALISTGADELAGLTAEYENCTGAAKTMADQMLENLAGAMESLDGSIETLKLDMYYAFLPSLKDGVKWLDSLVSSFNGLDDSTKMGAYKIAGVTAAIGPMLLAGSGLIKIAQGIVPALSAIASPLGVVTLGVGLFAAAAIDANNDIGNTFVTMSKSINTSLKKINSTLASDMKTISSRIPALTSSLITGIKNIVPEFMNTAGIAIAGFMDAMSENADEIADVGATLITSLLDGISANLPSLVQSGASMITSIVSALAGNMPSIVEAAGNVALALGDGITGIDWVDITSQLTSAFTGAIDGLTDVLGTLFDKFKTNAGEKDWASIGTQIIDLILGATVSGATSIGTFISNLITDIGGYTGWESLGTQFGVVAEHLITGIANSIPAIDDTVAWIVTSIGTALSGEGVESLSNGFKAFAGSIIKGVGNAIPSIENGATTIISAINTLFSGETVQGLADSFADVASSIIGGIVDQIPNVANAAVNIIGAIGSLFSAEGAATSIFDGAVSIAESIIGAVCTAIPTIGQAAIDIVKAIGDLFTKEGAAKTLNDGATSIATSLLGAVTEAIPSLTDTAKGIISALGDTLAKIPWADNIGNLTSLGEAIFNAIAEAIKGAGDIASSIVSALGDAISKIPWDDVSINLDAFADMVLNGIVNGLSALETAGTDIVNAVGTALGKVDWAGIGTTVANLAESLIDGIVQGLGKLSESGGIDGLITALGNAIVSAASGLATAASTLVGDLVGYLTDPSNIAQFADVGVQFVGGIVKGVLNLGSSLIEGAADVLTNTIVGFFRGLFGIDVDPFVESSLQTFSETVYNVPTDSFDGYGQACGAALISAMRASLTDTSKINDAIIAWGIAVENGYSQFLPEYEYLGNESVMSLYRGLASGIENENNRAPVEQSAKEAALLIGLGYGENLENALYMNHEDVVNAMAAYFSNDSFVSLSQLATELGYDIGSLMGFSLPEGYEMAIVNGEPAIIQASQELIDAGEAAIASGWNIDEMMASLWEHTFNTSFSEISKWKPELITLLENMGVEAGSLLGVALPDGVAEGLKNGTMTVQEAAAAIALAATMAQSEVDTAVAENSAKGEEAGDAVATGVGNAKEEVSNASTEAHDAVTEPFTMLETELQTTTSEAMTGMQTSILEGQPANEAAALQVSDAVVKEFLLNMSAENGTTIGSTFVNAIKDAIVSCEETMKTTAGSVASAAASAASSALSSGAGNNIGLNFAKGIAQGIRNGSSAIMQAAQSAASQALLAAKSRLGIHSPSAVAEKEIGWMFDEGLANGVIGRLQVIESAASQAASLLRDQFMVGDLSRGTIYTDSQSISQTAKQTAEASNEKSKLVEHAEAVGKAIADRLIEAGVFEGDVVMDGTKVGKKVSKTVSKAISVDVFATVKGRATKGVI